MSLRCSVVLLALCGSAAAGELLTDPRDTHGIPLLWTDRDVPGDLRGALA